MLGRRLTSWQRPCTGSRRAGGITLSACRKEGCSCSPNGTPRVNQLGVVNQRVRESETVAVAHQRQPGGLLLVSRRLPAKQRARRRERQARRGAWSLAETRKPRWLLLAGLSVNLLDHGFRGKSFGSPDVTLFGKVRCALCLAQPLAAGGEPHRRPWSATACRGGATARVRWHRSLARSGFLHPQT